MKAKSTPQKKQIEEASGKKGNGLKKEASENARGQEECGEKSEEADPREVKGSQKTLTNHEIEQTMQKLQQQLEKELNAVIR